MKSLKAKFRKTDTNEWNKNDERLLAAVEHGEVEKVASLLAKKGSNAVKLDNEGKSALHLAAAGGHTDCLAAILAHGADLSVSDASGMCSNYVVHIGERIFYTFHKCKQFSVFKYCTMKKLNQLKTKKSKLMPNRLKYIFLHASIVLFFFFQSTKSYLDFSVVVVFFKGFTALHLAAKNNHVECCKKLVQNKCAVDATDNTGKTALHYAAANGNIQIVQLLCELRSPINLKDADALTPLLLAAKHCHSETCCTLLDFSADINTPDNTGRTAVMVAAESNAVSVVEVLVQRGADLSAVDLEGHDVLHYVKMSPNAEARAALTAVLNRNVLGEKSPKQAPQTEDGAKTVSPNIKPPKSPQSSEMSPSALSSTSTPTSNKSETPNRFDYKEDKIIGSAEREEVKKPLKESILLLQTIKDLKQTVETLAAELDTEAEQTDTAGLVSALQEGITVVSSVDQHLENKLKKLVHLKGNKEVKENSRPNSMASNSSPHSTHEEFDPALTQTEAEGGPEAPPLKHVEEDRDGEEVRQMRLVLEGVKRELLETKKENCSLQAQLKAERGGERGEDRRGREELMKSLADLQAKLTDTQEKYHQVIEERDYLREHKGRQECEPTEKRELQTEAASTLEQELKELKIKLLQLESQKENATLQIRELQEALERTEEETQMYKDKGQRAAQIEELYKKEQEKVWRLQEEQNEVQERLSAVSQYYNETKSELSATQKELAEVRAKSSTAPSSTSAEQLQVLSSRVEELQALLTESEWKCSVTREELAGLKQEAEAQAQCSVALTDHTQVVSSLEDVIRELQSELETLREELHQKTVQVEDLQKRLTEQEVTSDDSVPREEHETMREQLRSDIKHQKELLEEALRKQDELALEAAHAWQKARDSHAELEALQELLSSREKENQTLTSKLAESQDAVTQLKMLEQNHIESEREKDKEIDDLTRQVVKLKDAVNSLSQLSYSSCSPSKRQQQNQQLEALQQQIKQLQYQLDESTKHHNEVVSVYRKHLLYAVQGQMDEDVQNALKQILMMCKMPSQAEEAC
uniref:Retinoic acid induced 14 n=1 Tax=Oryzias sinensis TaxID=183150 RepID=A0A8C7YZH5_9TELE